MRISEIGMASCVDKAIMELDRGSPDIGIALSETFLTCLGVTPGSIGFLASLSGIGYSILNAFECGWVRSGDNVYPHDLLAGINDITLVH